MSESKFDVKAEGAAGCFGCLMTPLLLAGAGALMVLAWKGVFLLWKWVIGIQV